MVVEGSLKALMRRKIAILGKNGRLGAAVCRRLSKKYAVIPLGREDVDLSEPISEQLKNLEFDLLINTAAATNLDWCENHPEAAERVNARAPGEIGATCTTRGVRCLHVSTDYVFDGTASAPYKEDRPTNPINVYGKTKQMGEDLILQSGNQHLVIRVSWVFGPDKPSFVDMLLDRAIIEEQIEAIEDKYSAPTYSVDFAEWIEPLLFEFPVDGILHLCNAGGCSWREYGQLALDAALEAGINLRTSHVRPISLKSMTSFLARRPVYTVMNQQRYRDLTGVSPRQWKEAVRAHVRARFSRVK
jgi:dTDP-4-dehydrorhamnose reductase